ncbi:MAG TPA: hypothetical protein VKU37_08170 [Verrucomicrobiae bacterium]|nr:hypothetical protein [Verrucomicrobiae bacterium]
MKQQKSKKSSESKSSDRFGPRFLATLPKKVAAAIKDVPLSEARKKLPGDLARHFEKMRQKRGADLESDILHVFSHLKNRSADDFQDGSVAQSCARDGDIAGAILYDNPTFKATAPIAFRRPNASESELIGSGVLIWISGRVFLLTAAHIADFANEGTLLIPGKDGFMSPSGLYSTGPMPSSGNRDDDKLDVAYVCLENNCAKNLHPSCLVLDNQDLSMEAEPKRRNAYTFAGYPWRKSRVKKDKIETEFITVEGMEVQKEIYETLGLTRSQHIVVRFNRQQTFSQLHKRVVVAPLPSGMSGGGVYVWSEEALKTWPVRLPLVGIANEFIPDKSLLVATRLQFYFSCIFHSHPELFTVVREG